MRLPYVEYFFDDEWNVPLILVSYTYFSVDILVLFYDGHWDKISCHSFRMMT